MRTILCLLLTCLPSSFVLCEESLIERIQQSQPGIVTIQTEYIKILSTPQTKNKKMATYTRTGAGIILDPQGILVTNTHIIVNAPLTWVILANGKKYPAQVLYANLEHDFSLLKINPNEPLTHVELADSNSARLGESVIVVGNSEFNQNSFLSSEIKTLLVNQKTRNVEFIEINLVLHQGDSGGPVFDRNGRLLGIVMAQHKNAPNRTLIIAANKIREQYWHSRKNMP